MHAKIAEETCRCVHSKNWHTCHKLDNLLLVQTLELSNNLQEPLCLPPLSSSPTIAIHTVYHYLDIPTPHSCIQVITVDGPIGTQATRRVAQADAALGHRYPPKVTPPTQQTPLPSVVIKTFDVEVGALSRVVWSL